MLGENQNPDMRQFRAEGLDAFQSVSLLESQVHYGEVRLDTPGQVQGFGGAGGFAASLEVRLLREQPHNAAAEHRVIVDDQHPGRGGGGFNCLARQKPTGADIRIPDSYLKSAGIGVFCPSWVFALSKRFLCLVSERWNCIVAAGHEEQ